jgi:hypothetical protein
MTDDSTAQSQLQMVEKLLAASPDDESLIELKNKISFLFLVLYMLIF